LPISEDLIRYPIWLSSGNRLACACFNRQHEGIIIMNTGTNNNIQDAGRPPLPPTPIFDEQHLAQARPVQPLSTPRRTVQAYQTGGRLPAIAILIAAVVICVGIGAAAVDLVPQALPAADNTAEALSEPVTPENSEERSTIEPVAAPVRKPPQRRRRTITNFKAREAVPSVEFSEDADDRKPRARLVSVIH
jgi:hypothetical protein